MEFLASPFAAYFRDHPRSSVPSFAEYCQIIKNPIWLKEVANRLRCACYVYVHEWVTDMEGVWENALSYNEPESEAHYCALVLQKQFKTVYLPVPNSDDDVVQVAKEKSMSKLGKELLQPPPSLAALNWGLKLKPIAAISKAGQCQVKWGPPIPIKVSPLIKALCSPREDSGQS
jgi:hypothetical protein